MLPGPFGRHLLLCLCCQQHANLSPQNNTSAKHLLQQDQMGRFVKEKQTSCWGKSHPTALQTPNITLEQLQWVRIYSNITSAYLLMAGICRRDTGCERSACPSTNGWNALFPFCPSPHFSSSTLFRIIYITASSYWLLPRLELFPSQIASASAFIIFTNPAWVTNPILLMSHHDELPHHHSVLSCVLSNGTSQVLQISLCQRRRIKF